jgi:hypothetical protein
MTRSTLILGSALVLAMAGCGSSGPSSEPTGSTTSGPGVSTLNDGITLSTSTPQRIAGLYTDAAGETLQFDLARVNDDVYLDLLGNGGRPILHIDTNGDDYNFSYMGGGLTMHTTKQFVAQVKAETGPTPSNVSTSGFAWSGDTHVMDEMLALPEIKQLPTLSRALGARGITGMDYPAVLALHKVAQQAAMAFSVKVPQLSNVSAEKAYCDGYPNSGDGCFGMCGPGCDCWSWVCGDCCYHYGCAVHDNWCREGEWWYCYDITAVIAIFGC